MDGGLFKIKHVDTNRYIIRSMLNNRMTFGVSGTDIMTEELTAYDSDVSTADMFYINYDPLGIYTIEPCSNPDRYVTANDTTASGTAGAPDSYLTLSTPAVDSYWFLHRYMGADRAGGTARYTVPVAGKQGWFKVYAWSTIVGVNEQYTYIHSEDSDLATGTWNSSEYLFYVTPHYDDAFRIKVDLRQNNSTRATLTFSLTPKLPFEEGVYFFKNGRVDKNIQVEKDDEPDYDTVGAQLEIHNFTGETYQRWEVLHYIDQYYRIKSNKSGHIISVQLGKENVDDKVLVQQEDSTVPNNRQLWSFEKTSRGTYIIRPQSGVSYDKDWCMSAGDYFLDFVLPPTQGLNVEQKPYTNDSDYRDEWILDRLLPTSGYEIEYNPNLWNSTEIIMQNTNCYAYALNNQLIPNSEYIWFMMQPGEGAGFFDLLDNFEVEVILDYVEADADALDFYFEPIGKYEVCPAGSYKVALVFGETFVEGIDFDYHWYRQNPDGSWSHKPGGTPVTDTDASGNKIFDPETADRCYSYANYDIFVGFYAITPLNNIHPSAGMNKTIESNEIFVCESEDFAA